MWALSILEVLVAVVVTENDVLGLAVLVLDVQVGDASTVWDERSFNALGLQGVLLEWVAGERGVW